MARADAPNSASSSAPSASLWPWLGWALVLVLADQVTKQWILGAYRLGDATYVTGFFNIVRAHNTGAAFSFLAGAGGWQRWLFTGIGLAATLFITWQLRRHAQQKMYAFALASILGGAIGNVVDRLQHGYVVDFLDFHWPVLAGVFYGGHFPAFNLADVGISVGAACLILDELLRMRKGSAR
jgi:signal peptidase II